MKKGFMNSPRGNMNAVNNKPGDGLRDLALKIKNIDGKMIRKPIRGEPNPEFLGVKISDTLLMKPVIHNPVGQPLKSILKGRVKVILKMIAAVCSLPEANVSPLSHAKVNGNINTSKVNISMLSNDLVIPGADIALPSVAVDAKTNEYANTLYGYFIGRRHAVPIVDSYVNNAWSRFGLQRSMFHHGFFFFQFKTKAGMEQVLAKGPWRIRNVPIMLNIWNPTKKLVKEKVKTVQVWVKLHNVPVVAFSELSLSLITTKVGKPIMLDAHTADMCVNSWGRCSYARVLIEVSAERALVESFVVAVPKTLNKNP
ncbi:zinc knuckle CX2CX4HX4C containing protein [Tanacetum coccineum]